MQPWISSEALSPHRLFLPGPVLCLCQLHGQRRSPVHHSPAGKVPTLSTLGGRCFSVRSQAWAVMKTTAMHNWSAGDCAIFMPAVTVMHFIWDYPWQVLYFLDGDKPVLAAQPDNGWLWARELLVNLGWGFPSQT